ncbi:MAG: FKBP-type peptidyl-prolyl cis-trans isomerase [Bacteroidota bacterium]
MKLKYIVLFSGIAFLSLTACEGQKNKETKTAMTTTADSVSYAIGISIGGNLKKDNLDEINVDLIADGIKAAMKNDSSIMNMNVAQSSIQGFMQGREKKKGEANIERGKKFLEDNAKKEGVKTTASGLQYQIVKEGTGPKPALTDKVSVHYHGTLVDGKVFDSSVERGQPAEFGVNQVIPGWTEALQMMPVGSKWKLWIPSNIAYGERSPGGSIGPNETLIFEVELLAIVPAAPPKEPGK